MLQEHIRPFFNNIGLYVWFACKENGMGSMIGEKCDVILTLLDY